MYNCHETSMIIIFIKNCDVLSMKFVTIWNSWARQEASVLNIHRLNRKIIDRESNQRSYSPSTSVLITFESTALPEKVALLKVSSLVNLYVPQVKICLKYLRYGHISTNCRSDFRCRQCGGTNTHSDQDPYPNANSVPKCVPVTVITCLIPKIAQSFNFRKISDPMRPKMVFPFWKQRMRSDQRKIPEPDLSPVTPFLTLTFQLTQI